MPSNLMSGRSVPSQGLALMRPGAAVKRRRALASMSASDFASGLADNSASTDTGRSIAPSGRPAFTSEGRVSRSSRRACMPALASTRRLMGSSFHSTSMGTRSSPMRKTADW